MGKGDFATSYVRAIENVLSSESVTGEQDFVLNEHAPRHITLDYIYFVDGDGVLVEATGGSVEVTYSPVAGIFRKMQEGSFSAAEVTSLVWSKPSAECKAVAINFSFTGVTGAVGFRALVTQSTTENGGSASSTGEAATTSFGEASVANPTPVVQITAQYGLRADVLSASIGGSTDAIDSKFTVNTGTGATNVTALVSAREVPYRAGQGLRCLATALFSPGVVDASQLVGLINSEAFFGFGYDGTEFGIVFAREGGREQQELEITTGAAGAENATVTIDNIPFTVPLTGGTVQKTAYEVAASLNPQHPAYNFTSVNGFVYAIALLSDLGAGTFSFSSATAAGTFTEIEAGSIPVETWVKQEDWNVNPGIDINPQLGNVYQIQLQYLGFGGIKFFIEDPATSKFELVHVIRYANTATIPLVKNPIFRCGWAARNTGNTTDITVQGASAAILVEGKIVVDGSHRGVCSFQTGIGTTRTSILAIQNRLSFSGVANRSEIIPRILHLATDTIKTALFEIVLNPIIATGEFLDFQSTGDNELAELAQNTATVTGGQVIACFNVQIGTGVPISFEDITAGLSPGQTLAIVTRVSGGSTAEMSASLSWQDDL